MRCGGCGARYVGDPCHGKFYYRCHARCKRLPTVRETVLNETVKQAVKDLMVNPAVILEPLRQLDNAEARKRKRRKDTAVDVERELQRLEIEEGRILDAYRTGIVTPSQLGQQLETLKARRATLEAERSDVNPTNALPREHVERVVTDYCAEAASSLANFTVERWQAFLRTLIHTIIFEGSHVRIQGQVPIDQPHHDPERQDTSEITCRFSVRRDCDHGDLPS